MKIIVLGHRGMLGHVLSKFLQENNINIIKCDHRWPSKEFIDFIKNTNANYVINCIGEIPQKNKIVQNYIVNNYALPIFLSKNCNAKLIHATTDCEFAGTNFLIKYSIDDITDAEDDYGISKKIATADLLVNNNCTIIRSSIIGPELTSKKSLWEWFSNCSEQNIKGFRNHYWNGVTTLEWSKKCLDLILNKKLNNGIIQLGSNEVSKYDILTYINKHLKLNKNIVKFESETISKLLQPCVLSEPIENQIKQLIEWYF